MTRSIPRFARAFLVLALAAGSLGISRASAQEAIMLETIGAVRMASPDEVRRMTPPAAPPAAQPTPAEAPRQHAAVTQ